MTELEIRIGSIADVEMLQAEAYVVAANNELWMGSGVAGALKRVAGEEVEQEAIAQAPIEVGEAVSTSAGRMPSPARMLIHAAAMGFTDRTQIYASLESVLSATTRSLELCRDNGLSSVAFPALGTGVGGLELEDCATAMSEAVAAHQASSNMPERVFFVVTNEERADIFRSAALAHGLSVAGAP